MNDLHALQGIWQQIAFDLGSGVAPAAYDAPGTVMTISGMHFSVSSSEGTLLLEGAFRLHPNTTPKAVDWLDSIGQDADKALPAIYTIEGDQFMFVVGDLCVRPTVFRTAPGVVMRWFVRRVA
jgi:uncharacterized protein (TIGR03067 family)